MNAAAKSVYYFGFYLLILSVALTTIPKHVACYFPNA